MVYTEIKERKGKKYYYRVKSLRKGKRVEKERVYLGEGLKKEEISKKEIDADKELGLLSSLLSEEKIKELEKIKREYLKDSKGNYENKYEYFVSLFTYDSTNIEGNTLTLQETSQLLFEGQTPRKATREINEVLNHKQAFDFVYWNILHDAPWLSIATLPADAKAHISHHLSTQVFPDNYQKEIEKIVEFMNLGISSDGKELIKNIQQLDIRRNQSLTAVAPELSKILNYDQTST
jgi:uncharacterized protein YoaH (UPF0181 family)